MRFDELSTSQELPPRERRRAPQALKKKLSLLTSTFEATADAILAIDLDENIITWNAKFAEMWGLNNDGLAGPSGWIVDHMLGLAKDRDELKLRIEHSF